MSPYPVGVRFHPSEPELVGYYLFNKIYAENLLSGNEFVKECDLYGCLEPSDIWCIYGGDDLVDHDHNQALYFFTKLKKKSCNGSRICRTVASGTWAGEDSGETIKASNVMGFKKRFRYENPKSTEDRAWIMHEFTIGSHDVVLCRLKKNRTGQRDRKRKLTSSTAHQEQVVDNFQPKRPRTEQIPIAMQQNQQDDLSSYMTIVQEVMPVEIAADVVPVPTESSTHETEDKIMGPSTLTGPSSYETEGDMENGVVAPQWSTSFGDDDDLHDSSLFCFTEEDWNDLQWFNTQTSSS